MLHMQKKEQSKERQQTVQLRPSPRPQTQDAHAPIQARSFFGLLEHTAVCQFERGDMQEVEAPYTTGIEIEVRGAVLEHPGRRVQDRGRQALPNGTQLAASTPEAPFGLPAIKVESEGEGIELISGPLQAADVRTFYKAAALFVKQLNVKKTVSAAVEGFRESLKKVPPRSGGGERSKFLLSPPDENIGREFICPPKSALSGSGGFMVQTNTAVAYEEFGAKGKLQPYYQKSGGDSEEWGYLQRARGIVDELGFTGTLSAHIRSLFTQIILQAIIYGLHDETGIPTDKMILKQHFDVLPKISTADVILYVLTDTERGELAEFLTLEKIDEVSRCFKKEASKISKLSESKRKRKAALQAFNNSLRIIVYNLKKIADNAGHEEEILNESKGQGLRFRNQADLTAELDAPTSGDYKLIHDTPRTASIIKPYVPTGRPVGRTMFILEQRRKFLKANEDAEKEISSYVKKTDPFQ